MSVLGTARNRSPRQDARADAATAPLLSHADLSFIAALRLPTFRAAGASRLERLTLVIDRERTLREVRYPVSDIAGSVVAAVRRLSGAE